MIDLILEYAPYALTILNALISFLTYRRTGKVVKTKNISEFIPRTFEEVKKDELLKLSEFHRRCAEELESSCCMDKSDYVPCSWDEAEKIVAQWKKEV